MKNENVNAIGCVPCEKVPTPRVTLCEKVESLHAMISDANRISYELYDTLFGDSDHVKCEENSAVSMDDDLDKMGAEMKWLLDRLSEIRERLG